MDILQNILNQVLDENTLQGFSKELNVDTDQIKTASTMLIPSLFKGLNTNVQDEKGADSLLKALDQHKDADVSNINNFLGSVDLKDGAKILEHILGTKQAPVQKEVAKKSGLSAANTQTLMTMLAPLIMAQLAKSKSTTNDSGGGLIGALASNLDVGKILTGLLVGSQVKKATQKATTKKSTNKKVVKVEEPEKSLSDITDLLGNIFGNNK